MLAVIGAVWLFALFGDPLFRLILSPLFVTDVVKRVPSPDGAAVAEIEVRKGGFGTVWTTRVHLRPNSGDPWTIYQTKDSDFIPPLKWLSRDTLLVGLPCYRFDHASNPDDWDRTNPNERRLKVRFQFSADCLSGSATH